MLAAIYKGTDYKTSTAFKFFSANGSLGNRERREINMVSKTSAKLPFLRLHQTLNRTTLYETSVRPSESCDTWWKLGQTNLGMCKHLHVKHRIGRHSLNRILHCIVKPLHNCILQSFAPKVIRSPDYAPGIRVKSLENKLNFSLLQFKSPFIGHWLLSSCRMIQIKLQLHFFVFWNVFSYTFQFSFCFFYFLFLFTLTFVSSLFITLYWDKYSI